MYRPAVSFWSRVSQYSSRQVPRVAGSCGLFGSADVTWMKTLSFSLLQTDVAESQLIVGAGTGEELDDVLLIAQLKSEEQEKDETACQQQIQRAFVTPEKVI